MSERDPGSPAPLTAGGLVLSGVAKIGALLVSWRAWGLVLGAAIVFWIITHHQGIDDYFTSVDDMQKRVAISVASPTVHTRERLLNDRFEQVSWLERELELTNPAIVTRQVAPDDAEAARNAAAAWSGTGTGVSASRNSDTQIRYGGGNDVRQSFELMNGFRDVLRSERARAMLDDRHDVDDNTLDLFSFDTTWMPRGDARGYAAVEAFITHMPEELDEQFRDGPAVKKFLKLRDQDVFDIYSGWLEKVRGLQESNLKTMINDLDVQDQFALQPGYGTTLRVIACSELLRASSSPARSGKDNTDNCKLAALAQPYHETRAGVARAPTAAATASMRAIESLVKAAARATLEHRVHEFASSFPVADAERIRSAAQLVLLQAGRTPDPAPWVAKLGLLLGSGGSLLRPAEEIVEACDHPNLALSRVAPALPSWLLNAFAQNGLGADWHADFVCSIAPPTPNSPYRVLAALIDKLAELKDGSLGTAPWREVRLEQQSSGWRLVLTPELDVSDADIEAVSTSCLAATLMLANIVEASTEQPRNHGASLTKFFDFETSKLTEGCSLHVTPLVTTLQVSEEPVSATPARSDKQTGIPLLKNLRTLLETTGYGDQAKSTTLSVAGANGAAPSQKIDVAGDEKEPSPELVTTHAYGYSLSPRLRQNVQIKSRQSDQFSAGINNSSLAVGDAGGLDYLGVQPEVIGFNRPDPVSKSQQGARFGWLVTPRPDKDLAWSVPMEQTQLGAVVSLPSWWRSALLQICTRFVPENYIGEVLKPTFWENNESCRVELIRLPGSAIDVSRRLGMDVLTTPYQQDWGQRPVLHAGLTKEPTHLLINGERLWRNTVVTLGGQKADQIEVMPDMVGIIATFRCIRMPTNSADTENFALAPQQLIPNPSPPLQAAGPPGVRPPDQPPPGQIAPSPAKNPTDPPRRGPGTAASDERTYTVPVVVWTSEGHTRSQFATVKVGAADPCPASPPNSDLPPANPPRAGSGAQAAPPG